MVALEWAVDVACVPSCALCHDGFTPAALHFAQMYGGAGVRMCILSFVKADKDATFPTCKTRLARDEVFSKMLLDVDH